MIETDKKAEKDGSQYGSLKKPVCQSLDIMRIVYRHIEQCEQKRKDEGASAHLFRVNEGFVRKPDGDMPVQKKGKKKKYAGQNIAGLHPSGFHQCPCREKTFDDIQNHLQFFFFFMKYFYHKIKMPLCQLSQCEEVLSEMPIGISFGTSLHTYHIESRGCCQRCGKTLYRYALENSGYRRNM